MKPKLGTFVTALLAGTFANNPVKQLVRGVPPRNPRHTPLTCQTMLTQFADLHELKLRPTADRRPLIIA
jgi:hypothetical protein